MKFHRPRHRRAGTAPVRGRDTMSLARHTCGLTMFTRCPACNPAIYAEQYARHKAEPPLTRRVRIEADSWWAR